MPLAHQLLIDLLDLLVEICRASIQLHAEVLVLVVSLQVFVIKMLADSRTNTSVPVAPHFLLVVVFGQVFHQINVML